MAKLDYDSKGAVKKQAEYRLGVTLRWARALLKQSPEFDEGDAEWLKVIARIGAELEVLDERRKNRNAKFYLRQAKKLERMAV